MSKKLITLQPLTPFFFGGENTFGAEGEQTNYLIRSNYLPQQTTILGFLRYELLAQNKLLGTTPDANWEALIGKESFQNNAGTFTSSFGAISHISPIFLTNGTEHYLPQALDWAMCEEKKTENGTETKIEKVAPISVSFSEAEGMTYLGKERKKIPHLMAGSEPYNPKLELKALWVNTNGTKLKQWDCEGEYEFEKGKGYEDGFFIKTQQIGIHRKMERDREDTGDFYKQVFYKLVEGFSFAFYVDIDVPNSEIFTSRITMMGAERSTFFMTVKDATDTFTNRFNQTTFATNPQRKMPAIVLMSDGYCEASILDNCNFAITDSVPFRNMKTEQKAGNNYSRLNAGVSKSTELLYLLKKGSVLYPSNFKAVKDVLYNPAFHNIGYNHFIELP